MYPASIEIYKKAKEESKQRQKEYMIDYILYSHY